MDVACIEKILEEKVKELLRSGRISVKEYTKIKKIVKRNLPSSAGYDIFIPRVRKRGLSTLLDQT